jgi:UbiD family decarboxylase
MSAFRDLRSYMDTLVRQLGEGEVRTIDGAHWDLEIGCITELMAEKEGPALLFDNIVGYPKGHRVLTNFMGTPARCAIALGLSPDLPKLEIVRAWKDKSKGLKLIPPTEVANGPVMENIQEGDAVDLTSFPAPKWHEHDGGRYMGTADMVITRDPDTGWVNIGTHRGCIQSKDRLSLWLLNDRHARMMATKHWARGEACPIAVVFGCDPVLWSAAPTPTPMGVSEYDLAGALRGEPVEVMRAPGTGLPIPAYAEIVIEGEMPPIEEESAGGTVRRMAGLLHPFRARDRGAGQAHHASQQSDPPRRAPADPDYHPGLSGPAAEFRGRDLGASGKRRRAEYPRGMGFRPQPDDRGIARAAL